MGGEGALGLGIAHDEVRIFARLHTRAAGVSLLRLHRFLDCRLWFEPPYTVLSTGNGSSKYGCLYYSPLPKHSALVVNSRIPDYMNLI